MKEAEIRPLHLFNRYLELSRADIGRFFSDRSQFVEIACPACGDDRSDPAFEKFGCKYRTCRTCWSLYLSPRPSPEAVARYYRESEAARYWATDFFRETEEARREKMFRPRAQIIAQLAAAGRLPKTEEFVDVGSGYGTFLEEVARLDLFARVRGIEPGPELATVCRAKGFEVTQLPVEAVPSGSIRADVATAFEVLEHVFDPSGFIKGAAGVVGNGGVLLFTTLTISGFDLQVLWSNSKSIYPPHHINLLSFEGVRMLVERCGLQVMELSTPGKLDVDIVVNALREDPSIPVPRFVSYLVERCGQDVRDALQQFLQQHDLSSHIRCLARKGFA